MRQQDYRNAVDSVSSGIQTTGFTLDVNQSMFQMLTANVYNNPVLAVVREWSTNACDACIDAGTEVKFDVHIPTLSEPTFYVRDYGTGLTPEKITGLFSTLGASTKRDSDEFNGTLGIGRMAGLAVGDAFTVDSYVGGMLYSYVVSMQDGIPVTMHLGAVPTSEPNGLKLGVSVLPEDMHKYKEEAEYLYKYFDHKPNLNLDIDIDLPREDQLAEDWFIKKHVNQDYNTNTRNFVVMAQVPYEIPHNGAVDDQGFSSLVVKVPPGSVTFNPGRETLSLDRKTVKYLNEMFQRVAGDFLSAANNKLVLCDDDVSLYVEMHALRAAAPHKLRDKIDVAPYVSQHTKNMFSARNYWNSGADSEYVSATQAFQTATNDKVHITVKSSYYKTAKKFDQHNTAQALTFLQGNHVVIDVKTNFRQALNDHYASKSLFIWQRPKGGDLDDAVEESKAYLETLGIEYVLASTLIETVELKPKEVRKGLYASDVSSSGGIAKSTKIEGDAVTDTDYLLLPLSGTSPDLGEGNDFHMLIRAYCALHRVCEMPEIKGVPKKYLKLAQSEDNWHDFATYIKEQAEDATFKQGNIEDPIPFTHTLIDSNTMSKYPEAIQKYFLNDADYRRFRASDNYVHCDSTVVELKAMGATFERYQPTHAIDEEELKAMFPKTLPLLVRHNYGGQLGSSELAHFAKMEEFYAIHSNEKRDSDTQHI